MNNTIPKWLQNPEFRFYLIRKNGKLPMEKKWNSENNYPFFHSKLINHLEFGGNYGICTGYANLIIIDFDDFNYYKSIRKQLPYTFTTVSAGKRCPHYYYILKGEMIQKTGIDDKQGKRVCDIQSSRAGIVAPGSSVDRKYYEVHNDRPIATITLESLQRIFPGILTKAAGKHKEYTSTPDKESVIVTMEILKHNKVERTGEKNYACPFHTSEGKKSLTILNDGSLYCFHCQTFWPTPHHFVDQMEEFKNRIS